MDAFAARQAAESSAAESKLKGTTEWFSDGARCVGDENNQNYGTWMLEVNKGRDGKWKQTGNWFLVQAQKVDGMMSEIHTFKDAEAAKDPNAAQAQFIYSSGQLDRIRIKSKEKSSERVGETGFITVLMVDKESDIPVEYREEAAKMKLLARAIERWFQVCSSENFVNEIRREQKKSMGTANPQRPRDKGSVMETQELHRGRLIDHLQLVVRDLEASKRFYGTLSKALGIPLGGEGPGFFWIDELFVSSQDSVAAQGRLTGRVHLAFQAASEEMVVQAYKEALNSGGQDNGEPGPRPYHPGYYAAFVLDPDGNNIEVVYHGPAKRSSDSVKITF